MRKHVVAALLFLTAGSASAQTLFSIGNDTVTVKEFMTAYQKNNADKSLNASSVREYLDLYIASRLKIREAKDKGYDTLPQLAADLQNLRTQIVPGYLTDGEGMKALVYEAFARAQKDIHLAHIFVAAPAPADTAAAWAKVSEAYQKLQKGADFPTVAKEYSSDPSVKDNGGDVGYITVFTLPYHLETLAYNTPAGKFSPILKSKGGYHIFKNLGERKALGRMKASQILLAFPPGSTDDYKASVKKLADSLYNRLLKGDDFGKLAAQYSNDAVTAASNGLMQEFGVGDYNPQFEAAVFALSKDGALSKPFFTTHGWHIVRRLGRTPVSTDKTDDKALQQLREKVEASDRINITKDALAQKVIARVGVKTLPVNNTTLWAYTDSILDRKQASVPVNITGETVLLQVSSKSVKASDWINFAQQNRYKADGSGFKSNQQVWDEFVRNAALAYYQDHLEEFNPDFKAQVEEFRDGNLFFEIMQRRVWGPAQNDTAALEAYYQQHKANYVWNQSADAVVFYAGDAAAAQEFITRLKKAPTQWRKLQQEMMEKVAADSNRFELSQLPNPKKQALKAGTITAPLVNATDKTASFAYVLKVYTQPEQRSFAEAKGLVINDYQAELEKKWVEELKAKYPVRINEDALASLLAKN